MDRNKLRKIVSAAAAERKRTIAFQNKCYTSLKDLIHDESMQISPSYSREDLALQLKNPLLQTAAWAYLQPMMETQPEPGNKWFKWLGGIKNKLFGCISEVLEAIFKGAS